MKSTKAGLEPDEKEAARPRRRTKSRGTMTKRKRFSLVEGQDKTNLVAYPDRSQELGRLSVARGPRLSLAEAEEGRAANTTTSLPAPGTLRLRSSLDNILKKAQAEKAECTELAGLRNSGSRILASPQLEMGDTEV